MKYLVRIAGMGLAMLTDVAVGIIIAHLIGKAFGYDVPIYFYPIGAFLALLPDIDYPYHLWQVRRQKREFYETHRLVPHYPIMIIPICLILGILSIFWPIFIYWIVVAVLCLFSHYVHDTITGIRWLAPRGKKYYRFSKKHFIVSWSEEEWRAWIKNQKEDKDYFKTYLQFTTRESVIGPVLFMVALFLVLFW